MSINVQTATGENYAVEVSGAETVQVLREKLAQQLSTEAEKVMVGQLKLTRKQSYGEEVLEDKWVLKDHGVEKGATVGLVIGAPPLTGFFVFDSADEGAKSPAGPNTDIQVCAVFGEDSVCEIIIRESEDKPENQAGTTASMIPHTGSQTIPNIRISALQKSDSSMSVFCDDQYSSGTAWLAGYRGTQARGAPAPVIDFAIDINACQRFGRFDDACLAEPGGVAAQTDASKSALKLQLIFASGSYNDGVAGSRWVTLNRQSELPPWYEETKDALNTTLWHCPVGADLLVQANSMEAMCANTQDNKDADKPGDMLKPNSQPQSICCVIS